METLVLKSELETTSDIDLLDVCLSSGDLADLAKVIQANGYRGTRKFRTFSDNVTAFGSTIAKGESVDVVVTDNLIYDKGFDYGFVKDGVAYSQNGGKITTKKQTRNLCLSSSYSNTAYGVDFVYSNGVFTLNGTCNTTGGDASGVYFKNIILPAGTYTLSTNIDGDRVFLRDSSSRIGQFTSTGNTITLDSDTTCHVAIRNVNNTTYTNQVIKVQIEQGDTATAWVAPLIDVTYTLQLPSEELQPQQSGDDWLVPAKDEENNDGLLNLTTLEFTAV